MNHNDDEIVEADFELIPSTQPKRVVEPELVEAELVDEQMPSAQAGNSQQQSQAYASMNGKGFAFGQNFSTGQVQKKGCLFKIMLVLLLIVFGVFILAFLIIFFIVRFIKSIFSK